MQVSLCIKFKNTYMHFECILPRKVSPTGLTLPEAFLAIGLGSQTRTDPIMKNVNHYKNMIRFYCEYSPSEDKVTFIALVSSQYQRTT